MSLTLSARRTRRAVAILAVGLLAAVVPGSALAAGNGARWCAGSSTSSARVRSRASTATSWTARSPAAGSSTRSRSSPCRCRARCSRTAPSTSWATSRLFGTFKTTYTYTARFDGATELHGRCHHPILDGDGVFAGARGEMSFTDVVDANPVYYPYWGNIRLGRKSASGPSQRRRRYRLAWPGRRRGARPRPQSPRPASRWRSAAGDDRVGHCRRREGTIAAYFRRYAAGDMPVARRNRRRKNVGSS